MKDGGAIWSLEWVRYELDVLNLHRLVRGWQGTEETLYRELCKREEELLRETYAA